MPKQNPFSFYDFLGYFVPGAIFLYGISVLAQHANLASPVLKYLQFDLSGADEYLPFVLAAYAIGHVLSFTSSVTVERYSTWALGYPSKFLLGYPHPNYFRPPLSPEGQMGRRRWALRLAIWIFVIPISLLDAILGRGLKLRDFYAERLDSLLARIITGKLTALFEGEGSVPGGELSLDGEKDDFFRFAYHYAVEFAPNHLPKMQNYVALYGFLRTLSFISLLGFWIVLLHTFTRTMTWSEMVLCVAATSILTYVFFMAFQKFYRRFSLEALMAVCVCYPSKGSPRGTKIGPPGCGNDLAD